MPMIIGGCQSIFDAGIDQRRCRRWRERELRSLSWAFPPFVSSANHKLIKKRQTQWQSRFKHQWEKPFVSRPFFYVFSSCIVDWHFFHHFAHQQIWNIDISIKTSCCNSADSRLELRCKFGEVAESRLAIDQLRLCHTSDQLGDCYTSIELSWMFLKKFKATNALINW